MKRLRQRLENLGLNRDAHNERVKLLALSVNATGLASLIGGVLGPVFDPTRPFHLGFGLIATLLWALCLLAAFEILGYMKSKD